MAAEPEQLEPVGVDPIAAPPGDLGDRLGDAAVLDLRRPAAARADDVVVVGAGAGHVGVLAGRQIEALDDPELGQQVQRPEERRPADPEPAVAGRGLEIGRGEVAVCSAMRSATARRGPVSR